MGNLDLRYNVLTFLLLGAIERERKNLKLNVAVFI